MSYEDYTIGWICALPLEMAAAKAMFDERHEEVSHPPSTTHKYAFGKILGHKVVVACLPHGVYGTVSAASVVMEMRLTFPLRFALMVGIGGGVPSQNVRLGDVVVSRPTGRSTGIEQYDYGKSLKGGKFERTGKLNKPPHELLAALSDLDSEHMMTDSRISEFLEEVNQRYSKMKKFTSPPLVDQLFRPDYDHESHVVTCDNCDPAMLVFRQEDPSRPPQIHYGLIASGNQVMKDARLRDKLSDELNILCFEMEAAGVMDTLPCLAIRGICDYADSHKNDDWQTYAAGVASAYAKELLSRVPIYKKEEKEDFAHIQEKITLLKSLPFAEDALFDARSKEHIPSCLPGTRVEILDRIMNWAAAPDSKPIFWLSGMAGTGKTTIALTVAQQLANNKKLGASFFFSRSGADCSHAERFCTTIASQLASSNPELGSCICKAVQEHQSIISQGLRDQWKQLILEPIASLRTTTVRAQSDVLVLVIDAIDECDNDDDIEIILKLLPQVMQLSTTKVRIFLTSRPEIPIRYSFSQLSIAAYNAVDLVDIEQTIIQADIYAYLKFRLGVVQEKRNLTKGWPGQEVIQKFADQAGALFIYAATICRFIEKSLVPTRSLDIILSNQNLDIPGSSNALDGMYMTILNNAFWRDTPEEVQEVGSLFQQVVGIIVLSPYPLSPISISSLLRLDINIVSPILNSLHSVLLVPKTLTKTVRVLHTSFRDFILSADRCTIQVLQICEAKVHRLVTAGCLDVLSSTLKRDIAGLSEPGARRESVCDEDILRLSPEYVRYACCYWAHHFQQQDIVQTDYDGLYEFLKIHLLHWFEAMSLLKELSSGILCLGSLRNAMTHRDNGQLFSLLNDARRFALESRYITEIAPLQLYSSALIFSPADSLIRSMFWKEVPQWIEQFPEVPKRSSQRSLILHHCDFSCDQCIIIRPHENMIIASCEHFLRVWDTISGTNMYTMNVDVSCIHVSNDGVLLAAGLDDGTILLWDLKTGEELYNIREQTLRIYDIKISNDNKTLAFGLGNGNIWLSDITTGRCLRVLDGEPGRVRHVTFVPRSHILVSVTILGDVNEDDTTFWNENAITLWNMEGYHPEEIFCFRGDPDQWCISPDGKSLAFWDQGEGVCLYGLEARVDPLTLEKTESHVKSLWFSSDSTHLCCEYADNYLRAWDVRVQVNGRLGGSDTDSSAETSLIQRKDLTIIRDGRNSVGVWSPGMNEILTLDENCFTLTIAWSSDRRTLAVGCLDGTIRVFNLSNLLSLEDDVCLRTSDGEKYRIPPFQEQHSPIDEVTWSPDGLVAASLSADDTLQLWDPKGSVTSSQYVGFSEPRGHPGLAFSNDGLFVGIARSENVQVYNVQTTELHPIIDGFDDIGGFAFCPVSHSLGFLIVKNLSWFSVELGVCEIGAWPEPEIVCTGGRGTNHFICFSPDGSYYAADCIESRVVIRYTHNADEVCHLKGRPTTVQAAAFSPDGISLATGSVDGSVKIWDAQEGDLLRDELDFGMECVYSLAFCPNGTLVVHGNSNSVGMWDPVEGERQCPFEQSIKHISCSTMSYNGRLIAIGSDLSGMIGVWNLPELTPELTPVSCPGVSLLALSPDCTHLASTCSDEYIRIWDISNGVLLHKCEGYFDVTVSIAFSHDGKLLASASGHEIQLWDSTIGHAVQTVTMDEFITSASFSPTENILAIGDNFGSIHLENLEEENFRSLSSCHFPGKFLTELRFDGVPPPCHNTFGLTFSHDGSLIACALDHHEIHIWDRTKQIVIATLPGHSEFICSLAFHQDGTILASGSRDHTVRLWDVTSQEMLAVYHLPGPITRLRITNDGSSINTDQGLIDVSEWTSPQGAPQDLQYAYSFSNETHWVMWRGHNVLWIPPEFRSFAWDMHMNRLAIGLKSGRVIFMYFSERIASLENLS